MTDFFALLGEPRRPWLDPDQLKTKFLSLSTEVHPDRVHSASESEKTASQNQYTDLNAAYNCLREPRTRLGHLLELEHGARPEAVQSVPQSVMDLFAQVGALLRSADSLLKEKNALTSPILKAQLFARSQPVLEQLDSLKSELAARESAAIERLRELDQFWMEAGVPRSDLAGELDQIRHLLNYISKWSSQVQERSFQLTL